MASTARRRDARIAIAVLAVLAIGIVSGCGPAGSEAGGPTAIGPSPAASSVPSMGPVPATPSAAVPDVPVSSADLAAQAASTVVPPVSLRIPAQDIALPVDPVGVQADGQMEIPRLAERGGWYRFGAAPGEAAGTSVIAAHVDSIASAGLGPFARLKNLAPGDAIEVTLADGGRQDYSVTTVSRVAKSDVGWQDVFVRGGPPRLVLITCGGVFQPAVGHYADNVIVTADPVGP
ncbi:MAG: sortase domain-bontaining protein [Cellulomonas sp.]